MTLRMALLASGRGSNVQAILAAIAEGRLDAHAACLISNIAEAPVLDIGRAAGIPSVSLPHRGQSREAHEDQILAALEANGPIDTIVLAGYMRLFSPQAIQALGNGNPMRIINIHPSLLPAFPGTKGYEDAYTYGVKVAGVTVHFVDSGLDSGPVLLQRSFPRLDTDTLAEFRARGLALEHALYPEALQLLAENRVRFRYDSDASRPYVTILPAEGPA